MSATVNQPPILDSTGQSIAQKVYSIKNNLERNFKIIEANPQGEATDDLSKLKVGEDIFNVGGGGGSSVEVIPELTSGVLIARILVDGSYYDIYAPEGGGGGGGSEEATMITSFTDMNRIANPYGNYLNAEMEFKLFSSPINPYNDLIPKMTSNTTPSGVASASTEVDRNHKAYMAFDGYVSYWLPLASDEAPYLKYEWESGTNVTFTKLEIGIYNDGTTEVSRTVTIEGLTDEDVWENCLQSGSYTTLSFPIKIQKPHFIDLNGHSYKAIRMTGNEAWYVQNVYACLIESFIVY